jgi:hypothetical protein
LADSATLRVARFGNANTLGLGVGVRQDAVRGETDKARRILIAVARYLAAHSRTELDATDG